MSVERLLRDILPLPPLSVAVRTIRARLAAGSSPAEALKLDPVCAAWVLRAANAPATGLPECVSSLTHATALLSLETVDRLVVSANALAEQIPADCLLTHERLWRHSLVVGRTSEAMAKHLARRESINPEALFTAGLLHDIGRLWLILARPDAMREAVDDARSKNRPLFTCEEPSYTHAAAGEALCKRFHFPPAITAAVAWHHQPLSAGVHARMAAIVHVADIMAHVTGVDTLSGDAVPDLSGEAATLVGIPPETLRVIAHDVIEEQRKIDAGLGLIF